MVVSVCLLIMDGSTGSYNGVRDSMEIRGEWLWLGDCLGLRHHHPTPPPPHHHHHPTTPTHTHTPPPPPLPPQLIRRVQEEMQGRLGMVSVVGMQETHSLESVLDAFAQTEKALSMSSGDVPLGQWVVQKRRGGGGEGRVGGWWWWWGVEVRGGVGG